MEKKKMSGGAIISLIAGIGLLIYMVYLGISNYLWTQTVWYGGSYDSVIEYMVSDAGCWVFFVVGLGLIILSAKLPKKTVNIPITVSVQSNADELVKLKGLLDAGAITQEEYDAQKAKLLK